MNKIKKLLEIRNSEDFFSKKNIISIILICFLLYMSNKGLASRVVAYVFTLFWISINTYQIFSIFYRKKCDFILYQSPISNFLKFVFFLKGAIIENIPFYIFLIFHLIFFMKASVINTFVISTITFFYAISLGSFFGRIFYRKKGLIILSIIYLFCIFISSKWTDSEIFRFIYPTIQLHNVDILYISTIFSILTITLSLLLLSNCLFEFVKYKKAKVIGILAITITLFIGLHLREFNYNKKIKNTDFNIIKIDKSIVKYRGIDEKDALFIVSNLREIENELIAIGINDNYMEEYIIDRYYRGFLYKTRGIPVYRNDNKFYINIFSNGMLNFKEEDIYHDLLYRFYNYLTQINDISNNYLFISIKNSRELILRSLAEKNNMNKLADSFKYSIKSRYNRFLLSRIFIENYDNPEDLKKVNKSIRKNLPKDNEELIEILEENLKDTENKKLIDKIKEDMGG